MILSTVFDSVGFMSGSTQTLPVDEQNLLQMTFLYNANFVIEAFSSENAAETNKSQTVFEDRGEC